MISLAVRSMRQHALSSAVTVFAVALASGLVMSVFSIQRQAYSAFTFAGGNIGFDAVLGAKGSELQLVLNTVFHLETSPGKISWSLYADMKRDPRVSLAIPYAVGDHYRDFRIVGTTAELFERYEFAPRRKYTIPSPGVVFDEDRMEAVIGSAVAEKSGLTLNSTFHPQHLAAGDEHHHEEEYRVIGVMAPTNTPADRVIWIPIEGMFRMSGHTLHGGGEEYHAHPHEEIPDTAKEVNAVMLKFRSDETGFFLKNRFNVDQTPATLAWPIQTVMADFFSKIGWMSRVLELVAYLVVLVSAATILAGIYNTLNERRREFAILRALGAQRMTVFGTIVLEAGTIAALGASFGFAVHAAIMAIAAAVIHRQTGVVLDVFAWHPVLIVAPLAMTAAGAIVGVIPAMKAYSTDVATTLVPQT